MRADQRFQLLESVFHEALGLPASDRAALLERRCGADAELRAEVEALLAAEAGAATGGLREQVGVGRSGAAAHLEPGTRIGPYEIVALLAEGGMGEVYRAAQTGPLEREVALKLVKAGMDTRQVLARFENERQALALMSHPDIARVFDAGATETGRPYFAMELVDGRPINTFCDQEALPLEARLRLFLRVCDAVHHAHQRGVVHRDLKPSNILVADEGGEPAPKIIDFGIAKATEERTFAGGAATRFGQVVGTPDYMSPEQAGGAGGIDTRTDVFSLGVVLYELLTGTHPFGLGRRDETGPEELLRRLREEPVARPSTRWTRTGGEETLRRARERGAEPPALARLLRGDLDWIVCRALEKEPERRYGSVAALADDLERHLADEPVAAGPPDRLYRARKFIRRHRVGAAAATVATLALLVGSGVALVGLVRALRAEREAVAAARRATVEAETAREVSEFLVDLFDASRPGAESISDMTARELLALGVERIRNELGDQPLVRARLLNTLGVVHDRLSLDAQAVELLEEAATLREQAGGSALDLAESLDELGTAYTGLDRYDDAERALRRSLELLGGESGEGALAQRVSSTRSLALVLWRRGDLRGAIDLYEEALAFDDGAVPTDERSIGTTLRLLGGLLVEAGRYEEALPRLRRAVRLLEASLGEGHVAVAFALQNLGNAEHELGQFEAANQHYRRALAIQERVAGPDSASVGSLLQNVASAEQNLGHLDVALRMLTRAVAIKEAILGPRHSSLGYALNNLGNVELELGQLAEARAAFTRAHDIFAETLGPENATTSHPLTGLADVLLAAGKAAEALPIYEQVLAIREARLDDDHPYVALARSSLGECLGRLGRSREATPLFESALTSLEGQLEPDHPYLYSARTGYARVLLQQGRAGEAEETARRAITDRGAAGSAEPGEAREVLAAALDRLGRSDEAAAIRRGGAV